MSKYSVCAGRFGGIAVRLWWRKSFVFSLNVIHIWNPFSAVLKAIVPWSKIPMDSTAITQNVRYILKKGSVEITIINEIKDMTNHCKPLMLSFMMSFCL